jgi:hypothetical protein
MASSLQKQRIGNDGSNSGECRRTRNRILRAVKQHTHDQPTLRFTLDRNRRSAATARLLFIG